MKTKVTKAITEIIKTGEVLEPLFHDALVKLTHKLLIATERLEWPISIHNEVTTGFRVIWHDARCILSKQ